MVSLTKKVLICALLSLFELMIHSFQLKAVVSRFGRRKMFSSATIAREIGKTDENTSKVYVKNTQLKIPIDKKLVEKQAILIKSILKVDDFQLDIWFCTDKKMKQLNLDWRNKRSSTDVLSFPTLDFETPEVLPPQEQLSPVDKHLGDMVLSPSYILRQCEADREYYETLSITEEEEEEEEEEDAGVSKAMARLYSVEERIPLMLIHGLLHLLGHDHEEAGEWRVMTRREEEVMRVFYERWEKEK